ncbi:hypothetical protein CUU62_04110 [Pseudomonas sp. WP001]|nr:hypothetical protein CUU62_04110 [Pseudomonas sp. WP001]
MCRCPDEALKAYKKTPCSVKRTSPSVGASLLAKNVNDNACFLIERGACGFSRARARRPLAPTKSLN